MVNARRFFCFLICLLSLGVGAAYASGWTEVRTLEGKFTTFSEQFEAGKWTLVMLWKSDCSICIREYPAISDFHTRHSDSDAIVLGVSLDGYSQIEKIRQHIEEMPMTFESLVGESIVVAFQYNIATSKLLQGTPTYLVYDPKGQLATHHVGPLNTKALEEFINRN